jgi:hypothetical protein
MYYGSQEFHDIYMNATVQRMTIWLRVLKCWYLVLGGVVVGHGFEPQSDLELFSANINTLC